MIYGNKFTVRDGNTGKELIIPEITAEMETLGADYSEYPCWKGSKLQAVVSTDKFQEHKTDRYLIMHQKLKLLCGTF